MAACRAVFAVAASLIQGSDGKVYGVTAYGGTANGGTVFKVTPSGSETVLHAFTGGGDGAAPQTPLLQGHDGNFYGTTPLGGSSSAGILFMVTPAGAGSFFKLTAAGAATVLYSFGTNP